LTIGWRWAFLVVGLLGILWVTIWAVTVSDKPGREATGPAAKADATLVVHQSIGFYIRQPIILFAALAFFGWNYILYFFLSWFPTYLTAANMSIVTIIPWLVGFVGLASGGFFVDWVVIRSGNALHARKMILVAGLLVAAICVGFASPCSMPAMPTALARPPHPRQRPPKAKLRRQRPDWEVPDFAPAGGGIASVVLFLFEKPGPKTAQAGGRIFFNQQRRSIRCRDV
jgi:predicted MFS family arabinose efflux permease